MRRATAPNECLGEITVFKKSDGPLTKRLAVRGGKIVNDSAACFMAHGSAHRAKIDSVQALADLINNFASNQAYALGRLKDGVPDGATVVVADELKDEGDPSVIARTKKYLVFKEGEPGFVLLDVDVKGMSDTVERRIEECGDIWGALCKVFPALKTAARVKRASTSSGLRNRDTGETFTGSGGRHIVIPVLDAADIPRFLSELHDRLWLAGLGWGMASAAGSFLERSLVDKSCGSPERLIFEGPPIIEPPLVQEDRNAVAHDGTTLDTRLCAPLTDTEKAELQKLKDAEKHRLAPQLKAAREAWTAEHVERLTANGMSQAGARALVDRWLDRQELIGDFPLPFDDPNIAGTPVADVLAAPDKYIGETLSDPFAGPEYGRGKAKLYRRPNGSLFIHSFAHGGIHYELKTKAESEREAEIERLAKLSRGHYEQARKTAVNKLKMRVTVLDEFVAKAKAELARKARSTPEAQEAERKRIEAAAEATRITRDAERERLWQSCSAVAMSKTLLADMEDLVHRLGVVREGPAIRAIYLAAMSRLGARVICLLRRGVSAGGKNYPITVALELFPEESIVRLSSGSPLSLIYFPGGEDAFRLKIIYIPEAAFLADRNGVESIFTYLLRTLISEGQLDHLVTVPQSNGPPEAVRIKRNGPVMIFLTSARKVEDELLTRLVVSDTDESQGQIEAVVLKDRNAGGPDEAALEQWRNLQRWLEFDAPYEVAVPFGKAVSTVVVREIKGRGGVLPQRLKRDINAIFAAIEASAILHKACRNCDGAGQIVATLDDYDNARAAFDVGLTTLYRLKTPETALAIVEAAEALGATTGNSVKITVRKLMEKTGLSGRQTVMDRLHDAIERGFLIMDEPKSEKAPRFYRLGKTSTAVKAVIENGEDRHVFPSREAIEQEIASPSPKPVGQVGQQAEPSGNDNVVNDLDAAPLSQPQFRTEKDSEDSNAANANVVPPCPTLYQTRGGTEQDVENTREKGDFDGPVPFVPGG